MSIASDVRQILIEQKAQAARLADLELEVKAVKAVVDEIKADLEVVENSPVAFEMSLKKGA